MLTMASDLVLVLNSGSSSLKFSLFDPSSDQAVIAGLAERLGFDTPVLHLYTDPQPVTLELAEGSHTEALDVALQQLAAAGFDRAGIAAAGHRVVHGGETFQAPVPVTPEVMDQIEALSHLAPLHNPANLSGMRALTRLLPDIPQVAVFDTAFHQTLSQEVFTYAIPHRLYRDHGLRRYGFHGTSHQYVAAEAARILQLPPERQRIITAHLGNGCSATAVVNGESVDTSMGLTPLEGLVMGTRSGNIDPSLHEFLQLHEGLSLAEITHLLNRESGLLGLSERSNDMRTLVEASQNGDAQAQLAIDVFCFRLAREISALLAASGGLDALVFTGGIGENAALIREQVINRLSWLGLNLDVTANLNHGATQMGLISTTWEPGVLVIPTREDWIIAQAARALLTTGQ